MKRILIAAVALLVFMFAACYKTTPWYVQRDGLSTYYMIESVPAGTSLVLYLKCQLTVKKRCTPLGPYGPVFEFKDVQAYYVPSGVGAGVYDLAEMKTDRDGVLDLSLVFATETSKPTLLEFVAKWPNVEDYVMSLDKERDALESLRGVQ